MRVGSYEVVERVGQGGAGVVFRTRRGADVFAVKLLKDRSPESRARFEREARLLGEFGEAEGFVPLVEHGECPDGLYLVMPFVEGGSLRDRLRGGPLALADALDLARSVGGALARAHERGIVHRDVKPENVLRAKDRWLLADLGVAKHFTYAVEGASESVSLSKTGALKGTIGYMAPEQLNDAKSAGPPADVFALGALVYEALAGEPPFPGTTVIAIVQAVVEGRVVPLRKVRPDVPVRVASAVHRALAADPSLRPKTARDFLDELERGSGPRGFSRAAALVAALVVLALVAMIARRQTDTVPSNATPKRPARPLEQELRALLKAGEAPTDDVVLSIAETWKDERIRGDALALAEIHPAPFVATLESRKEPRALLARAWLASGAVSHRQEIRESLGDHHKTAVAMALADGLAQQLELPTHLVNEEEMDRFARALANVAPATSAVRALVLAPFTSAVLSRFDRAEDIPTWSRQLAARLRKVGIPPELEAITRLQTEDLYELKMLETLVKEIPLGSPIGAAIRYTAIRVRAFSTKTTPALRGLWAETSAIHSATVENAGSTKHWVDAHEAIARAASANAHDWSLALDVAREAWQAVPRGDAKWHAALNLAGLELTRDPACTEVDGLDDFDPNRIHPLTAELLRRRGEYARARDICREWLRVKDTDMLALEILIRAEAQSGDLAAAKGSLHRLEQLDEKMGVWVPIYTKASTRAWLEELEAGRR